MIRIIFFCIFCCKEKLIDFAGTNFSFCCYLVVLVVVVVVFSGVEKCMYVVCIRFQKERKYITIYHFLE
jgi:hypothetical protein